MKYCLFCRDAFPDDARECPTCGGELSNRLPDPDEEPAGVEDDLLEDDAEAFEGPLLQVAIVDCEDDLRAAVEVLKDKDIYFEIEEVDRAEAQAGIIEGRAWRLLVPADEAHRAFLALVKAVPQIFPAEMRSHFADQTEEEECDSVVPILEEALEGPGPRLIGKDFAAAVIQALSCDSPAALNRAKYLLAKHADSVAPLLADIAAQAVVTGGEGAEKVLFNATDILDAVEYPAALEKIEPLYRSTVPQVRARAAYAAGRLGNPGAVDNLLDLLSDADEDVRYEAGEAIWRLTGMDFDFDAYAPLDHEAGNIARLRAEWERIGRKGLVRNRRALSDFIADVSRAAFDEGEEEA